MTLYGCRNARGKNDIGHETTVRRDRHDEILALKET